MTHPWLMSGKVCTFDFGICLRNIPVLVGTFQGIFESHSCKETCDVHVKSPNHQQAMKFTHLGLLVIEPFWSKLVLTQKWVSLSWEATHVGIMTYTKVMQKQPYSGSQTPSFIPSTFILVPLMAAKNCPALCCQWDVVLLGISVCSQIGDHL